MKNHSTLKLIIFIGLFFNLTYSYSQKLIGEIKIDKTYRNITNLSGALTNEISFHLLINKLKNNNVYETSITFFNQKELTKTILIGSHTNKPVFLSFHVNEMVLTLIEEHDKKTIVHDINYTTEKINSVEINQNPKSIFSHNKTTFIVLRKNEVLLDLAFIKSSQDIKRKTYSFKPGIEKDILNNIGNKKTDFVDNTVFINKGFINNLRAFYNEPSLLFLKDDKKNKVITLLTIEPDGKIKTNRINLKKEGKIKKLNSFVIDDLLFAFSMESKLANLSIYNVETLKLIKNFEYNSTDFGITNKVVKNGIDKTNSFKPKPFFKSYFPQVIGSTYNAALYVGVNKTTQSEYIVQVGHVDKNTFRNPNAGNFWWNYPAFGLNYNVSNGSLNGGFNPAGAVTMVVFEALAENKRKGNFFEINLNTNLEPTNEIKKLEFEYFDSEKYKKRLMKIFKLHKYYLIPLEKEVRLINFDKKNGTYLVYNLPKIK